VFTTAVLSAPRQVESARARLADPRNSSGQLENPAPRLPLIVTTRSRPAAGPCAGEPLGGHGLKIALSEQNKGFTSKTFLFMLSESPGARRTQHFPRGTRNYSIIQALHPSPACMQSTPPQKRSARRSHAAFPWNGKAPPPLDQLESAGSTSSAPSMARCDSSTGIEACRGMPRSGGGTLPLGKEVVTPVNAERLGPERSLAQGAWIIKRRVERRTPQVVPLHHHANRGSARPSRFSHPPFFHLVLQLSAWKVEEGAVTRSNQAGPLMRRWAGPQRAGCESGSPWPHAPNLETQHRHPSVETSPVAARLEWVAHASGSALETTTKIADVAGRQVRRAVRGGTNAGTRGHRRSAIAGHPHAGPCCYRGRGGGRERHQVEAEVRWSPATTIAQFGRPPRAQP